MKKLKVLDTFSGAGGFSLGFEMAGYDIVGAIEKDGKVVLVHPSQKADNGLDIT